MAGMSDAATKVRTDETSGTTFTRGSGIFMDKFYRSLISAPGFLVDGANWGTNHIRTGLGYDPVTDPFGGSEHLTRIYESYADNVAPTLNTVPQNETEQTIAFAGEFTGDVATVIVPGKAALMAREANAALRGTTVTIEATQAAALNTTRLTDIFASKASRELLEKGSTMWKKLFQTTADFSRNFAKSEAGGVNWKFWSRGADEAASAGTKSRDWFHAGKAAGEDAAETISKRQAMKEARAATQAVRNASRKGLFRRPAASQGTLEWAASQKLAELAPRVKNGFNDSASISGKAAIIGEKVFKGPLWKRALKMPLSIANSFKKPLIGLGVIDGITGFHGTEFIGSSLIGGVKNIFGALNPFSSHEQSSNANTQTEDVSQDTNIEQSNEDGSATLSSLQNAWDQVMSGDISGARASLGQAINPLNLVKDLTGGATNMAMGGLSSAFKTSSKFVQDVTHMSPGMANAIVGFGAFMALKSVLGIGLKMSGLSRLPFAGLALTVGAGYLALQLASSSPEDAAQNANVEQTAAITEAAPALAHG